MGKESLCQNVCELVFTWFELKNMLMKNIEEHAYLLNENRMIMDFKILEWTLIISQSKINGEKEEKLNVWCTTSTHKCATALVSPW